MQSAALGSLLLVDLLLLPHSKEHRYLESGEQLREGNLQSFRDQFQVENRDISFSPLDIRQKAPVNADLLSKFNLSPAVLLSELPNPISQARQQVSGHDPASSRVGNQLQIVFTQHWC